MAGVTRPQVYALLDEDLARLAVHESAVARTGGVATLTVGDYFAQFSHWVAEATALYALQSAPDVRTRVLGHVRNIGGLAVRCMQQHGAPPRDGLAIEAFGHMSRADVVRRIDEERLYQDEVLADGHVNRSRSIGDYLVLLDVYLADGKRAWAMFQNDAEALGVMRKLAAIAVRCLEAHFDGPVPNVAPAPAPTERPTLRISHGGRGHGRNGRSG